jgi:hypothetical protein
MQLFLGHRIYMVSNNYSLYLLFLGTAKECVSNPIVLVAKPNNSTWLQGLSDMTNARGSGVFVIEQSVSLRSHYGFKLRVPIFGELPCFRFDSDGPPHRNRLPTIPLPRQQVTTPHFHFYNSDGVLVAYKSPSLLDPTVVYQLRQDLQFGLTFFCAEAIMSAIDNAVLACVEVAASLPLPVSQDPLEGLSFDI